MLTLALTPDFQIKYSYSFSLLKKIHISHGKKIWYILKEKRMKNSKMGLPGGTVVKNPAANVGDIGSIPGMGRFYMPWATNTCVPQLLSRSAATTKAPMPRACAPQKEMPLQ